MVPVGLDPLLVAHEVVGQAVDEPLQPGLGDLGVTDPGQDHLVGAAAAEAGGEDRGREGGRAGPEGDGVGAGGEGIGHGHGGDRAAHNIGFHGAGAQAPPPSIPRRRAAVRPMMASLSPAVRKSQ